MGTLLSFSVVILVGQLRANAKNIPVDIRQEYQREPESSYVSEASNIQINPVIEWPDKNIKLGQVSGVALDPSGNVYVFHRGPRKWDSYTFNIDNVFILEGEIAEPTVAVIHPNTGDLLYEWGRHMFYLPHGITVDHLGNVWITDVAMHQVFKFPPILNSKTNNSVPLQTLGSKLQPGNGKYSFCKPTAVAVMSTGEFFVSDGYCNARIVKYAADGNFLVQWGRNSLSIGPNVPIYQFNIPHDLSLAEEKNLLYVSDRENGRIQCFLASNGSFVYQIQGREIGSRLYGASYTPANGGLLFIVNGPELIRPGEVHGSVVTANRDFTFLKTFQPSTDLEPSFRQPHDVIVSPNGTSLYVAELDPFRVWKFNIVGLRSASLISASKNSVIENQNQKGNGKTSGTMLMAIFITAIVLCFGAVLLTSALMYTRAKSRGCSGHCKNANWLVGRSTVDGFKLGNFLGQHNQGFVKLNNLEESDEDDANVSPTTFA